MDAANSVVAELNADPSSRFLLRDASECERLGELLVRDCDCNCDCDAVEADAGGAGLRKTWAKGSHGAASDGFMANNMMDAIWVDGRGACGVVLGTLGSYRRISELCTKYVVSTRVTKKLADPSDLSAPHHLRCAVNNSTKITVNDGY